MVAPPELESAGGSAPMLATIITAVMVFLSLQKRQRPCWCLGEEEGDEEAKPLRPFGEEPSGYLAHSVNKHLSLSLSGNSIAGSR